MLDALSGTADVVAVQDALALEHVRPLLVIGHVVAVSEKHGPHAAHLREAARQGSIEPGGIDQHVTSRAHYQVARRAERRLRGKAAEVDVLFNRFGKSRDSPPRVMASQGADRRGGTGDESL